MRTATVKTLKNQPIKTRARAEYLAKHEIGENSSMVKDAVKVKMSPTEASLYGRIETNYFKSNAIYAKLKTLREKVLNGHNNEIPEEGESIRYNDMGSMLSSTKDNFDYMDSMIDEISTKVFGE